MPISKGKDDYTDTMSQPRRLSVKSLTAVNLTFKNYFGVFREEEKEQTYCHVDFTQAICLLHIVSLFGCFIIWFLYANSLAF